MNAFRLEVRNIIKETRDEGFLQKIQSNGFDTITAVQVNDVYTIDKNFSDDEKGVLKNIFTNPVFEAAEINNNFAPSTFDFALEIGFLPGVTDNLGATVKEIIEEKFGIKFDIEEGVYTSTILYVSGVNQEEIKQIARLFANDLIQKITIKSFTDFVKDGGMGVYVPKVTIKHTSKTLEVPLLDMTDEEMIELGKKGIKDENGNFRGPLSLKLLYMQKIKEYFAKEGRNPTDIELESIAQTWSEHCRHTIFANPLDEFKGGVFKDCIRKATNDIRAKKGKDDFCVSVFTDNAGGIVFDENWVVSDKLETHNSPSALDPLGGAMTGIVGVNRDALGYGKGSKPVINRYAFCTGDPEKTIDLYRGENKHNPALQPKTILEGVVEGVEHGGNQSGIPTPQGAIYIDDRYAGKPLVFAGTVGLIPREINGKNSSEKQANPGEHIVMAGGLIGVDGIHGATFSSEVLDGDSPATAVQIGDPITQKKLSDVIVRELQDKDMITSVHDCGAGGISGTVGELGMEAGGFRVYLERAPLKYLNMSPWEIWISESQERMCFSVPANKSKEFCEYLAKRGVVATVLGEFTDTGRGEIFYNDEKIFDLDLNFLEKGWPKEQQKTIPSESVKNENQVVLGECDFAKSLQKLLKNKNIASFSWISNQYDSIVQGGAVVGPLQGVGNVNGTAAVTRPVLESEKAVVTSQALNPRWSEVDSYKMALASIDDAVAAAVAVGGNIDYMAIMDNFCWCSSDEPERLHQLKEAAKGCYDAAVTYGTPFISGKDSMFNDFKGYSADNKEVKISIPPTLLVSVMSVIDDYTKTQTMDFKYEEDLVYVIGETSDSLIGSQLLFEYDNFGGNPENLPLVQTEIAVDRYRRMHAGHQQNLFSSVQHIGFGGVAVAVAKSMIAGKLGLEITTPLTLAEWFAEDKSRFLVSINPNNKEVFESLFPEAEILGVVTKNYELKTESEMVKGEDLEKGYFRNYM
ncbi:phosphoribosylformylglycinamidine synthase [bacterium DOLZORAL124_38_8]|nr:MAG: phosphoribosylformylglycinamidine synthase [bacterium DOLZORAL124_38_8]